MKRKHLLKSTVCLVILLAVLVMSSVMQTSFNTYSETIDSQSEPTDDVRPVLIIGDDINYPPYSFVDENGQPAGFSIELIHAAADAMNYRVEYQLNKWNDVRNALEENEIDAISGMFYSEEREELYSFTTPHSIATGDVFSVKNNRIESIEELRGQSVVVQKSDIIHEYLLDQDLDIQFIEVSTVGQALELVSNGEYDYAALLKPTAHYIMSKEDFNNLKSSGLKLAPQKYCIAVNKNNDELVHVLNGGLQVLNATGEYQIIYDKWLGVYEEKSIGDLIKDYAWLFMLVGLALFALIALSVLLRHMVKVKTQEISETNIKLLASEEELTAANEELIAMNEEMESNFEELTAIEEELRNHYERLLESEAELKRSEERSRAIVNAIPDLLFIFDELGVIQECQASESECLTMPRQSFVGKTLNDIMPHDRAEEGLVKLKNALKTHCVQSFEYEVAIRGELRHFEIRLSKSQENEVVGITRDITDDYEHRRRIEYLSYHDQLTGLFNRRFFEEELARLDNASNIPFTLVMADVNGLKLINDSFGHDMGDQLLKRMATVLKEACSEEHTISRIGGDEFVILLPQLNGEEAEKLISRIQEISLNEKVAGIELSISYGWATKTNTEEHILDVLNKAEDYMYKRKLFEGPSMRGKTIGAIIQTLHEKNQREEEHSKRVSTYCMKLAKALDFSDKDVHEMVSAGLLHDIGKIAIAEYLLNKPGRLTDDEMEEVRRHPEIGYRILSSVNDMAEMGDFVLYHHERWDGAGYPKGLKGEEIPVQARIISIADSFDAMTSERSYKASMTKEEAIEELRRSAGTQFDPVMTRIFIEEVLEPIEVENLNDGLSIV